MNRIETREARKTRILTPVPFRLPFLDPEHRYLGMGSFHPRTTSVRPPLHTCSSTWLAMSRATEFTDATKNSKRPRAATRWTRGTFSVRSK